jgi:hypothetical protein
MKKKKSSLSAFVLMLFAVSMIVVIASIVIPMLRKQQQERGSSRVSKTEQSRARSIRPEQEHPRSTVPEQEPDTSEPMVVDLNTGKGLPVLEKKPAPAWEQMKGCPPEGKGGDPALNRLKNRTDQGRYYPVALDAIGSLAIPSGTRKPRSQWLDRQLASIARFEGIPVAVEGYLALVKNGGGGSRRAGREEGKESCNCGLDTPADHDYHLWLLPSPTAQRSQSLVVEMTPRVRRHHPSWTLANLTDVAESRRRVRISGWLLFDQEHPEQINKTRKTLWEIHPIMKVEVKEGSGWKEM